MTNVELIAASMVHECFLVALAIKEFKDEPFKFVFEDQYFEMIKKSQADPSYTKEHFNAMKVVFDRIIIRFK